jgi:PAS domain S-box-containing protein
MVAPEYGRAVTRPIRPPELSELETLTTCAAEGSLAAAAAQLGISRPAVAKRISALEAIVGEQLLHRDTRGVRLTEPGVLLVAHARRLLAERDALMEEIAALRGGERGSRISGMRDLLGRSTPASRAAQRPEAILSETEHLFEIVFHASATAVVISDPDTAVIHEANDAFCQFVGRDRDEVLGRSARQLGAWYSDEDRVRLINLIRRHGLVRDLEVRAIHPDGSVLVGRVTAQLVHLGGTPRLVSMIAPVEEPRAARRPAAWPAAPRRATPRGPVRRGR